VSDDVRIHLHTRGQRMHSKMYMTSLRLTSLNIVISRQMFPMATSAHQRFYIIDYIRQCCAWQQHIEDMAK